MLDETDLPPVDKHPGLWTSQERLAVIYNRLAWIQKCMDYNDREAEVRKLVTFVKGDQMVEERMEDNVIKLHDIARSIETNIGKGAISEDLRRVADRLESLLKEIGHAVP